MLYTESISNEYCKRKSMGPIGDGQLCTISAYNTGNTKTKLRIFQKYFDEKLFNSKVFVMAIVGDL